METSVAKPALTARQLHKAYGRGDARVEAVAGIDIELMPGEIVAIMGASGSGKTTLLHLLAGLSRADSGEIHLNGSDLTAVNDRKIADIRRKQIGIVFQAYNLLPTLTALDNVALPLMLSGERHARETARTMLAKVGLGDRAHRRPPELSGGEQQRIALARALVNDPQVILADEPTGNLDRSNVQAVCELFRSIAADKSRAIAIVTHEPLVSCHADRVLVLADGRVVDQFTHAEAPTAEAISLRCLQAARA